MESAHKRRAIRDETPLSGEVPAAVPDCCRALIERLAALDFGLPLEAAITSLLEIVRRVEPNAAIGVRLASDDASQEQGELVVLSAPLGIAPVIAGTQLFSTLGVEVVAPLPAPVRGTVNFAAAAFERLDRRAAQVLVEQVAAVVAICVRAVRSTTRAELMGDEVVQLEKLASIGHSAASIVHELNNPLTAIVAYGEYLATKLHGQVDDPDLERLTRIVEAAHRIQRYSRDLVDYSRPSLGLRAPVDLHEVIDRALGFCMHGLRGAAIVVEQSYGAISFVDGVESPLIQVFVNLFTNAWHAMADTGGTLRIETREQRAHLVIDVFDDGPGIPAEHLARVFDAYFTTKPKGVGTGLGLCIVRQIIGDHGGRISASNRMPQGAMFRIELPVRR
jgi:signal transduction histidine kinase